MRLIDADALKKTILGHCRSEIEAINHFWYDDTIITLIDTAPAVTDRTEEVLSLQNTIAKLVEGIAENARPQGEWIRKVDDVGFISHICSECGAEIEVEDPRDDNFCFSCGASMKGGAE